jgi:hypothetical protein
MEDLQAVQPRGLMAALAHERQTCRLQHVPGKWSGYVSHRRRVHDSNGGRHVASHDSESTEVAAPLVS